MENSNNDNQKIIEERLNRIKNKMTSELTDEELLNEDADQSSKSLDLNKLKEKVKTDNAPELKKVKELDKNIKKVKNEFKEASNTTITKEKFLNFIKQANDTFKNYEKQLQYYSIYSGKYNTKDLSVSQNIKEFCILADKKKAFESELNKLNMNDKNPDLKAIKKLYQEKVDSLFKENKNLSKVMEKMSNEVVMRFQNRIQELFDENTKLKKINGEYEEKLMKVRSMFEENDRFCAEMDEKNMEIVELNKQQILFMQKYENANVEIQSLTDIIKLNNSDLSELQKKYNDKINEVKKLKVTLEEKDNTIKEKDQKISEQNKEIKLLFDDSTQWEQKFNEKVKENENFKKWAMWDQDLIESFRKIEKLTEELNTTKKNYDKYAEENAVYKENNKKLTEELDITKKSEEKLKKENAELIVLKGRNDELEIKLKDYLELQKQNETYKKQIPAMKDEYETKIINDKNKFETEIEKLKNEQENKISEIKSQNNSNINSIKESHNQEMDKLNEQIQTLKETKEILMNEINLKDKNIEDLNTQLEKKAETLSNLKKSYDNLINKFKVSEEKLQQYEQSKKKQKSVFDDDDTKDSSNTDGGNSNEPNTNNNSENQPNNDSGNNKEKISTRFDQFSFTKEVLNDYLYCLYLLETGISIQNLVSNIMGNLSLYSNYLFRLTKINSGISNYPLNSIQNEFLEDLYFVAFDKYISKKILFNQNEVYIKGLLDKKILKANYEDFDQGTINEICLELINKNIMTKFKTPKTLKQLSQLFNTKYTKKFDFEGANLNDYLNKEIVPIVQKRILKYNKSIIDELRTLVELSLHNLHDGNIVIDGEQVYSFEKFFEQYNNYTNVSERNLKIDIENGNLTCGEGVDNIKHTMKYYYPQILRLDKCILNVNDNKNLGYLNKILACINYYQVNVSQLSFINNKLDKVFNYTILNCIKLIKTLLLLDLSNNGLTEENLKELLEYLKQNKTIKILYLNKNNISSSSGYYLADCLKKNTTIEILHLSQNKLVGTGLDSFLTILGNDNTTVKELDISYNDLTLEDFKILGNYLNLNPPLKSLDISGNNLIPQAANHIGLTFKKNKTLEEIKLNDCKISDDNTPQIIGYINEGNIHNLEMDCNKFGPTSLMLVLKKINISTRLKYISFQKIQFQKYFTDMIIQAIDLNDSIEKINLKQNKIKEDDLKKYAEAVSKQKNVKIFFSRDMVPSNASQIISGNRGIILQ